MSAERRLGEQRRWLLLVEGIVATIVGVAFLISPIQSLSTVMWIVGGYFVVHGLATLLLIVGERERWGWKVFVGSFSVIAGVLAMTMPVATGAGLMVFVFYFVAIQALVTGGVQFVNGVRRSSLGLATVGLVIFLLGMALVNYPMIGLVWLGISLGVFAAIGGLATILFALRKVEEPRTIRAG